MKFKFIYVLIYSVFSLMGLAARFFGIQILYKTIDLKYNGIVVKGTIVNAGSTDSGRSYIGGSNGRKRGGFFPVLQYTVNGKTTISTGKTSISDLNVAIGDEVSVVYRPSEPSFVEVYAALKGSFISGAVCTIIGSIFTFILALLGYRTIKLKREEQNQVN
jgi:hypothetical protein